MVSDQTSAAHFTMSIFEYEWLNHSLPQGNAFGVLRMLKQFTDRTLDGATLSTIAVRFIGHICYPFDLITLITSLWDTGML